MTPLVLPANAIARFYRGGARIAAFRGIPPDEIAGPEDWVGSATAVHGETELGRTVLAPEGSLADAFAADPRRFFGPDHAATHGGDPRLLVKLLDAGQRLPVHFHPDSTFARAHLGTAYGKTEAWVILDADAGASVHLGFARDVEPGELADWVARQDIDAMVASMRRLPVSAGDTVFVPAGLPHVIGEGMLILELQEPSDLSLLLEWTGVVPQENAFLGLPVDLALTAARRSTVDAEELALLTSARGASLFPEQADAFFRAERVLGDDVLDPGFAILVVVGGEGALVPGDGEAVALRRGTTVLVPYDAGECVVKGAVEAIRARPPASSLSGA